MQLWSAAEIPMGTLHLQTWQLITWAARPPAKRDERKLLDNGVHTDTWMELGLAARFASHYVVIHRHKPALLVGCQENIQLVSTSMCHFFLSTQ